MDAASIVRAIDATLSLIALLKTAGVNYREVVEAQERAEAEGRELSAEERQAFVDKAVASVGKL